MEFKGDPLVAKRRPRFPVQKSLKRYAKYLSEAQNLIPIGRI
jgi:hypothetical protein